MAIRPHHVVFAVISSLILGGLVAAEVTPTADTWQDSTNVFILPPSSDSFQAKQFYVVLPANETPPSGGEKWIEIKRVEDGRICYARWHDADAAPDHTIPNSGVLLSTEAANYLGIHDQNSPIQWRPVTDDKVPPGVWLKREEVAVLLTAIRESDAAKSGSSNPPTELQKLRAAYLTMYLQINEAEQDAAHKDTKSEEAAFSKALSQLQSLQQMAPTWERALVLKRIHDAEQRLDALKEEPAATPPPSP
jgi:hypothetical protein